MQPDRRRSPAVPVPVLLIVAALGSSRAQAAEPSRPPLAESLLTDSATDVDAAEGGEVEYEANFATVGARSGGAHAVLTSVEVEWRVWKSVGLRLEPSYTHVVDTGGTPSGHAFGVGGALAVGLFHDFARDLHLQAELLGRTPDSGNARAFEPGETELPLAADLLGAARRGIWTFRATAGGEAGASFAHAPLHTDLAVLAALFPESRFGFVALETRADWARAAPLVLAPEIVADATSLGLPFRLGVALPLNVGADAWRSSYGLFVRLILLTSREAEYGEARER